MFYQNSVSSNLSNWESILISLKGFEGLANIEQAVWEIARCSKEIPHIGNIYQRELLNRLKVAIEKKYSLCDELNIDIYINGTDTHLTINDNAIHHLNDLKEVIESMEIVS